MVHAYPSIRESAGAGLGSRADGRGVLACAVLAASCAGRDYSDAIQAKLAAIRQQAASDLSCPVQDVQVDPTLPYMASGCGKRLLYSCTLGEGVDCRSPLDRAAFDFSCDRGGLHATVLSPKSVGVEGCNQKAVYVLMALSQTSWEWVKNSSSTINETKPAEASKAP